jgi:DNA polymerase-3 subunit delta
MKIPYQQLATTLTKQLAPVYLLSGDEPYQRDEAVRLIREAARKQGYTERELYHVERGFDWQQLIEAGNTLSLFAERKLIELRLPSAKPGTEGAKILQTYLEDPPQDTILLIVAGKLEAAQLKSKWVKAIETAGTLVQIWPVEPARLPEWIRQALARRELSASPEALTLLAERVEGNLLAADQELEKLRLLYGPGALDVEQVRAAVSESARFDVFVLVDAALAGAADRVSRILFGLKAEGVEPILVLWALAREIRTLAQMAEAMEAGTNLDTVLYQQRVWEKRKPLVRKALQRISGSEARLWVMRCSSLDRLVKGFGAGRIWDELLELALSMAGRPALAS